MLSKCSKRDLRIIRRTAWAMFDCKIRRWLCSSEGQQPCCTDAEVLRKELRNMFESALRELK